MSVYRVTHSDMMGGVISEQFFDSKNKAKKALRRKFKELKPNMTKEEDLAHLSEPLIHKKQFHFNGKSKTSFELMFEVWHRCNYECEEYDSYVEGLHIDLIQIN